MATITSPTQDPAIGHPPKHQADQRLALATMLSLFFLFGMVTVLNDILIPHLKGLFDLSQWQASLVQFCFFGAYFVMSVPAGILLTAVGYKRGLSIALAIVAIGLLLFIPASIIVSYPLFLTGLFVVGSGFTVLQVAANPYVSSLGPPETATKRLNMAGFLNSSAATIGPIIGAKLILIDTALPIAERAAAVQLPYLALACFVMVLAIVINAIKLPDLSSLLQPADAGQTSDNSASKTSAWAYPHLLTAMGAIFVYVGVEVAVGSMLIGYMKQIVGVQEVDAAIYVSYYWGGLLVGRAIGIIITNMMSNSRMLVLVSCLGLMLSVAAILIPGMKAVYALVGLGVCHSVMWPCIFPMGIKHLGKHTAQGSGLLVSMIVGGAIYPVLQGGLIDSFGYTASIWILVLGYAYLVWYALAGFRLGLANNEAQ
jgi:FHS family L-fucose permease-like MFS transporter